MLLFKKESSRIEWIETKFPLNFQIDNTTKFLHSSDNVISFFHASDRNDNTHLYLFQFKLDSSEISLSFAFLWIYVCIIAEIVFCC